MFKVKNLNGFRNESPLFEDLSINVNEGELLYVRGNNGVGKTTLLRIFCGLKRPESGEILWNNQGIRMCVEEFRQSILYIGHENGIKDDLNVIENVHFHRTLHQTIPNSSIQESLEVFGMVKLANVHCRFLSAGQRRRVGLAKLLNAPQRLWFLDEPFTALDFHGRQIVIELIQSHLKKGGACVVTSHQDVEWNIQHVKVINLDDLVK